MAVLSILIFFYQFWPLSTDHLCQQGISSFYFMSHLCDTCMQGRRLDGPGLFLKRGRRNALRGPSLKQLFRKNTQSQPWLAASLQKTKGKPSAFQISQLNMPGSDGRTSLSTGTPSKSHWDICFPTCCSNPDFFHTWSAARHRQALCYLHCSACLVGLWFFLYLGSGREIGNRCNSRAKTCPNTFVSLPELGRKRKKPVRVISYLPW